MAAFRTMFLLLALACGCFADSGVKKSIYIPARWLGGLMTVCFLIAEGLVLSN